MKNLWMPWRSILAHDDFEIVGRAEAALAALHVDDGAERALERAAAAQIETRAPALRAPHRIAGQQGRRLAFDRRQILHVVVDGLELAGIGIAQDLVEPQLLGLAGEDRNALRLHARDLFGKFRQHGEAARDMKAADRHRQSGRDERLREIGGARKLVRLHADKAISARPPLRGYRR